MLSKYKQTYNNLTHTEFFVEGNKKSKEINKSKFTPHNLKSVILGANGLFAIYYTTNELNRNLVEWMPFKTSNNYFYNTEGVFMEEKYLEYLSVVDKEKKGMVDALYNELRFNFVEEIFILVDDFLIEQERNFEIARLNELYNLVKSKKVSMKRLMGIGILKISDQAKLEEGLKKLKPKKSIDSQLDDLGLIALESYPLNPERTELGLLFNPGLDASEYGPDQKYDPNNSDCAKNINCRLSKYFYDEEQIAIARKKKKDDEIKTAAEEATVKQYDEMLLKAVDSTIAKLERFYEPCFGGKFSGVIHKEGVLFSKSDTVNRLKKLTSAIYDVWASFTIPKGKEVARADSLQFSSAKGYFPGIHFEMMKSKEIWLKSKDSLRKKLLEEYSKYFDSDPAKITEIDRSITNCLVIKSRSKNQWVLRMTGISESQKDAFKVAFDEMVGQVYLGSATKGLIADMVVDGGIVSLTYIIDYDAFLNEVLFAYKQYRSGLKPSLSNALVGMKLNGTPLTIDLLDPRKMLITIIAGSRSGKGTMTMSLLATIFGSGGSVVYLDNKPDIGAMLWDLEREYASQGLKLLSVDMADKIQEFTGSTPIRSGPMNLREEDEEQEDLFKTLRMAKLFQLVSFIGGNSRKIKETLGVNPSNLFFISDEMTSTNIDYTKLCQYVEKQYKTYMGKAEKAKATDKDKETAEYYKKLNNILSKTPDNLTKGFAKDFGQSGVKIIVIGQQLNTGWKVNGTNFSKSFAGKLILNSHISFAGRLQATGETFNFTPEQESLAEKTGVFEYFDKVHKPLVKALDYDEEPAKKFTQFRSYFSIVKNDFDYSEYEQKGLSEYLSDNSKRFTSQYLNNFKGKSNEVINAAVKELYDFDKGCNKNEVSFSGLLKVMQEGTGMSDTQLIENMGNGYKLIDAVFRKMNLGNYSCVEEYLYDCSPASLFTQLELEKRFDGIIEQKPTVVDDNSNNSVFDLSALDIEESEEDFLNEDEVSSSIHSNPTNEPKSKYEYKSLKEETFDMRGATTKQSSYNAEDFNSKRTASSKPNVSPTMTVPSNAYRGTLKISPNPFGKYNDGKTLGTLNITKAVTEQIVENINEVIGPPDTITDFKVTKNGVLVFNGISYMPSFESAFIESLPLAIRNKVETGALIDLFDLREVYRYKNLSTFVLERESFAQGRARKEMGIGFRKKWSVLFKKFGLLTYIKVGSVEYVRDNPDTGAENKFLDLFKRNPQATYNTSLSESRMDRVWDSKPVRIITSAVGWTLGVQAVWAIAGLFGPWGLLFGAIAAAQTYTTVTGRSPTDRLREPSVESKNSKSKKRSK